MQVLTKVNRSATAEAEVQTEEPNEKYEGSDIKCRSDVTEETIVNYALRSQDEVKERGVKPLKWPALKEWKLMCWRCRSKIQHWKNIGKWQRVRRRLKGARRNTSSLW